jgi:hypothetical protein
MLYKSLHAYIMTTLKLLQYYSILETYTLQEIIKRQKRNETMVTSRNNINTLYCILNVANFVHCIRLPGFTGLLRLIDYHAAINH